MSRLASPAPKYQPGDHVAIDDRPVLGHCRTPWYLRGKRGEIAAVLGAYRDPERLAYRRPGYPAQVLYKVRFHQRQIWPAYAGPERDTLEADVYEHWLQPISKE
jgi:nitrile hydratase subunit beta